jgi:hypothetical protein
VKAEILSSYGPEEPGEATRRLEEVSRLCAGARMSDREAVKAAREALLPEGMTIVRDALTEARAANPQLVRRVEVKGPSGPRTTASEAQRMLTALGFDPGRADGSFGKKSRDVLAAFRERVGWEPEDKDRLGAEDIGLLRNACLLLSSEAFKP